MGRRSYIFTDKYHSPKAIMSTILGSIALISNIWLIDASVRLGAPAPLNYGIATFLALLYSVVGIVLAIISKEDNGSFHIFTYIGITVNAITLIISCVIFYSGLY